MADYRKGPYRELIEQTEKGERLDGESRKLRSQNPRHCKTKQKTSGCFLSWQDLPDYCKIRSLLDTTRKRRDSITASLWACSFFPAPAEQ